jgi:hypothetical protein
MREWALRTFAAIVWATTSPLAEAKSPAASGPAVTDVRLEAHEIKHGGRLYETQDFETVISAHIQPRAGQTLDPKSIHVYVQGMLVTLGRRNYDSKTGRFELVLSSKDQMAMMAQMAASDLLSDKRRPGHAVVVTARDLGGHLGKGTYDEPTNIVLKSEVFAVTIDPYGRHIRVPTEPSVPPARPVGQPVSLTPGTLSPRSPLTLRLVTRQPLSPEQQTGRLSEARLAPAPGGTASFSYKDDDHAFVVRLTPSTWRTEPRQAVFATPKGAVQRSSWSGKQLYALAYGPAGQSFIEAIGTAHRIVLPVEVDSPLVPSAPIDFWADDRQITYATGGGNPDLAACDWEGRSLWRLNANLPMLETRFSSLEGFAVTRQPDGSSIGFIQGEDIESQDHGECAVIAHVAHDGRLLATRIVTLIPSGENDFGIENGGGTIYKGRRLMVVNTRRFEGEHMVDETRIYDADSSQAKPLLVLGSIAQSPLEVYGAVVAGDHLIVGCGSSGIAVVNAN